MHSIILHESLETLFKTRPSSHNSPNGYLVCLARRKTNLLGFSAEAYRAVLCSNLSSCDVDKQTASKSANNAISPIYIKGSNQSDESRQNAIQEPRASRVDDMLRLNLPVTGPNDSGFDLVPSEVDHYRLDGLDS